MVNRWKMNIIKQAEFKNCQSKTKLGNKLIKMTGCFKG